MISNRRRRSKDIFHSTLAILSQHKCLVLTPLLSTVTNTLIAFLFIDPWMKHEINRIHSSTLPFYKMLSFYVMLLLFYYIRNLVNAYFNFINLAQINHCLNDKKIEIHQSIITTLKNWKQILIWSSFHSCLGGFYKLFSAVKAHSDKRQPFGGSYYHCAYLIASIGLLKTHFPNRTNPIKLLRHGGQLFTRCWGKPPLRQGFSIIPPLIILFFVCLLPVMFATVFGIGSSTIVNGALISSGVLLVGFFSFEKVLVNTLHLVLFLFCTQNESFHYQQASLKKAFVPFVIEE